MLKMCIEKKCYSNINTFHFQPVFSCFFGGFGLEYPFWGNSFFLIGNYVGVACPMVMIITLITYYKYNRKFLSKDSSEAHFLYVEVYDRFALRDVSNKSWLWVPPCMRWRELLREVWFWCMCLLPNERTATHTKYDTPMMWKLCWCRTLRGTNIWNQWAMMFPNVPPELGKQARYYFDSRKWVLMLIEKKRRLLGTMI